MKAKKVIKPVEVDEPVRIEAVIMTPQEPIDTTCTHNSLAQQGSIVVCLLCGCEV